MRTSLTFGVLIASAFASAGTLSTNLVSQEETTSFSPSWIPPVTSTTWFASTKPYETLGWMLQGPASTPSNWDGSFGANMYQTATFQFGFTTGTNESPPSNIYLHYSGSIVAQALEPTGSGGWAYYGSKVSGNSIYNLSCQNAWNNTAKGVKDLGPFSEATGSTGNVVQIPSTAFNGWTLVYTSGNVKIYKSVGTYTVTSPELSCGGYLGPSEGFQSESQWAFALWFLLS